MAREKNDLLIEDDEDGGATVSLNGLDDDQDDDLIPVVEKPQRADAEPKERGDQRLEADQRDDEGDDDEDDSPQGSSADEAALKNRREKRRAYRARQRQYVEQLEAQLSESQKRIDEIQRRLASDGTSRLESDYRTALQHVKRAEEALKDAVEKGDGQMHVDATRYRDEAVSVARQLYANLQRSSADAAQQQNRQQQQGPPPEVVQKVVAQREAFLTKHAWLKAAPQGDQDALIVAALDAAVAQEGYDPTSADYWDELDDRIRERLPHKAKVRGAKQPPVGGRSDAPSSTRADAIRIEPELKAALIEAGIWGDKKRLAKVLKDRARLQKEARQTR
jgi:hypothetical protein